MATTGVFFASRITALIEILERLGEPFERDENVCVSEVDEAKQAAEAARRDVGDTRRQVDELWDSTAEALQNIRRSFWMMSALLAVGVALALALGLRKPRRQIVKAVGQAAERLSQVYVGRRAGRPRRGIAMSGFQPDGQRLNVVLPGRRFARQQQGLTVGRYPGLVDAVLADAHVSRRHLRVRWSGKGFEVEDLNSSNGTIVNGKQLEPFQLHQLGTGDLIRIGRLELQVSMA